MSQHTDSSSYRERLIEHLFLGELLKVSWLQDACALEISKPEVDNSGYDVVAEARGIVRHIQLKTSVVTAETAKQPVHIKLATKPSGCVVWIYFDPQSLKLGPFRYFGGATPGEKMPSLDGFAVGRHTKWSKDAAGQAMKSERPNMRVVRETAFVEFDTLEAVYAQLFGPPSAAQQP